MLIFTRSGWLASLLLCVFLHAFFLEGVRLVCYNGCVSTDERKLKILFSGTAGPEDMYMDLQERYVVCALHERQVLRLFMGALVFCSDDRSGRHKCHIAFSDVCGCSRRRLPDVR